MSSDRLFVSDAVRASFDEAAETLRAFVDSPDGLGLVERFVELAAETVSRGGLLMSCGNGGSMCDAMHFAEEWTGRFRKDRAAIGAVAFSDPSHLTCIANDFGYDEIFAREVEAYGKHGDLLVLLSDVDGLHESRPEPGRPRPAMIDEVEKIDARIRTAASGPGSAFGSGGMATKLQAAETAARSGAATVVCNGRTKDVLRKLLAGERVGTLFLPGDRLASRKHWLAFTTRPRGELELDAGAVRALREGGKSLLPAGIVAVRGRFGIGDPVAGVDAGGAEVARGLAAYASAEGDRIRGLETRKVAEVLGYSNGNAVVHRDDLVLLEPLESPE